jgi:hypothetical protein
MTQLASGRHQNNLCGTLAAQAGAAQAASEMFGSVKRDLAKLRRSHFAISINSTIDIIASRRGDIVLVRIFMLTVPGGAAGGARWLNVDWTLELPTDAYFPADSPITGRWIVEVGASGTASVHRHASGIQGTHEEQIAEVPDTVDPQSCGKTLPAKQN